MFYRIIACALVCSVIVGAMGCTGGETAEPVVETPIVKTSVIETPVVETPVVETPVVETPVVETPVINDANEALVSIGDKKLTMQHILWRSPTADAASIALLARSWAETQLLYAEAEKRGVTKQPKSQFVAELNRRFAYASELKKQIIDKVEVSDETAQAYYEANKERLALDWGGTMGFVHITAASEDEAEAAVKRLKAGERFTKVCQEVSISADDAGRGGLVRKRPYNRIKDTLGRDLLKALAEAKLGELIGPVEGKVDDTYEIAIKNQDQPKTFVELKETIKRRLLKSEQAKAMLEFMGTLEQAVPGGIQKSQRLIEAEKALQEAKAKIRSGRGSAGTTTTAPSGN